VTLVGPEEARKRALAWSKRAAYLRSIGDELGALRAVAASADLHAVCALYRARPPIAPHVRARILEVLGGAFDARRVQRELEGGRP